MNDFGNLPLKGSASLFADDTAVFYKEANKQNNIALMKEDLHVISEYFRLNKLTLNLKKTKFINFHSHRVNEPADETVQYNGVGIEQVDTIKYLSITLDNKLNWKPHIHDLSTKLASMTGMLTKIGKFMPVSIMKLLYFSLVHSRIDYGALNWTAAHRTHLKKIQVLQNRALKRCFKLGNRFSTTALYREVALNVVPATQMRRYQACLFIHNALNGEVHTNLHFANKPNAHNTRRGNTLDTKHPNNWYGECSISYCGPKYFNELQNELKNCKNAHKFKKLLRNVMLEYFN